MQVESLIFLTMLFTLCASSLPASAHDLKVVTRHLLGTHLSTTTQYYSGSRARQEIQLVLGRADANDPSETVYTYGPTRATIRQIDSHRILQLDLQAHVYTTSEIDEKGHVIGAKAQPIQTSGGTLTVWIKSTDAGERKQMFGHIARHIVTTEKRIANPGAVSANSESVIDGWYIDWDVVPIAFRPKKQGVVVAGVTKLDKLDVHRSGEVNMGFPVKVLTISSSGLSQAEPSLQASWNTGLEVVELSEEPLNPALFEVPAGFRKVSRLPDFPPVPLAIRVRPKWKQYERKVAGLFH